SASGPRWWIGASIRRRLSTATGVSAFQFSLPQIPHIGFFLRTVKKTKEKALHQWVSCTQNRQKQQQSRNTGVSPLRFASVEMRCILGRSLRWLPYYFQM